LRRTRAVPLRDAVLSFATSPVAAQRPSKPSKHLQHLSTTQSPSVPIAAASHLLVIVISCLARERGLRVEGLYRIVTIVPRPVGADVDVAHAWRGELKRSGSAGGRRSAGRCSRG
jgi:hypothetical protein